MSTEFKSESFVYEGTSTMALDQVLRQHWSAASWSELRKLITTGKVAVDGAVTTDTRSDVAARSVVSLAMTRPRAGAALVGATDRILYCDPHVVVVNKPSGIASVDHAAEPTSVQTETRHWLEKKERKSLPPLRVVHRLDKVTSGVMVFARSHAAQADLKSQFRAHVTGRLYLAVAHGVVSSQTLKFRLVRDRGDGYRGVTTNPDLGRQSVTHVSVREQLVRCTLIECKLETGRTHQIRIHLAEIGHPLVGDPLYTRDFRGTVLRSNGTLLHAASLTFTHPVFRTALRYEQDIPAPFAAFLSTERQVRAQR